ncbi:uncharacterized protein LOC142345471 [Convolutriloba macropyga]|uniref:uncharacterized protein LOC142345471 n=1 Tax=Convolutriloba macropyga TaxID=536237 RepID=UPI003F51D298
MSLLSHTCSVIFVCSSLLLLCVVTEAFISKSHKSGWGGFEKRARTSSSLSSARLTQNRIPQRHLYFHNVRAVNTFMKRMANTNFIGSVFDESFEPESAVATSMGISKEDIAKAIEDIDMDLTPIATRENIALVMLPLCCATESWCLSDTWSDICTWLHLEQSTCFPLYQQTCHQPAILQE